MSLTSLPSTPVHLCRRCRNVLPGGGLAAMAPADRNKAVTSLITTNSTSPNLYPFPATFPVVMPVASADQGPSIPLVLELGVEHASLTTLPIRRQWSLPAANAPWGLFPLLTPLRAGFRIALKSSTRLRVSSLPLRAVSGFATPLTASLLLFFNALDATRANHAPVTPSRLQSSLLAASAANGP
jgi:hypothetical protein